MMARQPAGAVPAECRSSIRSVWGDFDGDGRPDEVFIDRHGDVSSVAVYPSSRREGQTLSTDNATSSFIAVDIDGDGDLDLIAASPTGSELWLNDGHGVFTPARVPPAHSLLASASVESAAPFVPFAVCTTPLSTDPVISGARARPVCMRAAGSDPWVSSPAFFSHLLRAPPPRSTGA
jgi:hypothetical protein